MVEWIVKGFLVLVALFFVLQHPDRIVDFVQVFIDGAHRAADALGSLDTHTPNKSK